MTNRCTCACVPSEYLWGNIVVWGHIVVRGHIVAAGRGQLFDTCHLGMCRCLHVFLPLVLAYLSIHQHTSAYVRPRQLTRFVCRLCSYCCRRSVSLFKSVSSQACMCTSPSRIHVCWRMQTYADVCCRLKNVYAPHRLEDKFPESMLIYILNL
jgi:hypothetical protein